MRAPRLRKLRHVLIVVLIGGFSAAAAVVVLGSPAHSAVVIDGSASRRAAASCWEIKQKQPSAADGRYWLHHPAAGAAAAVLLRHDDRRRRLGARRPGPRRLEAGRQRPGHNRAGAGTVTGQRVRASSAVLQHHRRAVGGRRVDALTDGIRLRRATNAGGTRWQEMRFTFKSRDRWSGPSPPGTRSPRSHERLAGPTPAPATSGPTRLSSASRRSTRPQQLRARLQLRLDGTGTNNATSYIYSTAEARTPSLRSSSGRSYDVGSVVPGHPGRGHRPRPRSSRQEWGAPHDVGRDRHGVGGAVSSPPRCRPSPKSATRCTSAATSAPCRGVHAPPGPTRSSRPISRRSTRPPATGSVVPADIQQPGQGARRAARQQARGGRRLHERHGTARAGLPC